MAAALVGRRRDGRKLADLAREIGVSKERVRQLELSAVERVRADGTLAARLRPLLD